MARKSRRKKIEEVKTEAVFIPEVSRDVAQFRTAAYARLSVDKGDDEKIETQIELIHQYIEGHPDLTLADTYVDNGYSGTSFDRPEFNRLMEDMKAGRIHCIVVKDLSRFGRDFLETGYYLETVLPHLNVRFISINDDFDSNRESDRNSIAVPIKNIINELYAKEASKKQTVYFEMCSKNGNRTIERGTFGYDVDRINNVLVVNPLTAPYVRVIFHWFLMGYTTGMIARRLNMLGARTPFYYKAIEERLEVPETDRWTYDRVSTILRNRTYAGDTVYGKRRKILYKNVDAYHARQEDWIIHKDTHEALVNREDFEKVQEMMDSTSRKMKAEKTALTEQREKFTDFFPQKVCCMECGGTMLYSRYSRSRYCEELNGAVYWCKGNGVSKECRQKIHEDYLKAIVMDQIRNLVKTVCDKRKLLKQIQSGQCSPAVVTSLRRNASNLAEKLSHTVEARESLYENLQEGIIDQEEYRMLKEHYILEEQSLKKEIADVEEKKRAVMRKLGRCLELAEHLEEFMDRQELDQKMAREFIDRIYVSSSGKIEIRFTCGDVFADLAELTEGIQ
ncbi:MAG: recombinase family protein [Lachnospiraceae bacterium]|nr:recombinase family protein [Lachnospiraceae bacterium]